MLAQRPTAIKGAKRPSSSSWAFAAAHIRCENAMTLATIGIGAKGAVASSVPSSSEETGAASFSVARGVEEEGRSASAPALPCRCGWRIARRASRTASAATMPTRRRTADAAAKGGLVQFPSLLMWRVTDSSSSKIAPMYRRRTAFATEDDLRESCGGRGGADGEGEEENCCGEEEDAWSRGDGEGDVEADE